MGSHLTHESRLQATIVNFRVDRAFDSRCVPSHSVSSRSSTEPESVMKPEAAIVSMDDEWRRLTFELDPRD